MAIRNGGPLWCEISTLLTGLSDGNYTLDIYYGSYDQRRQ